MPRAAVTWIEGEGFRSAAVAEAEPTTIGRAAGCAVRIEHETTVSREHARILPEGDGFVLEHLSQTNPTRLDADAITQKGPLADGSTIGLGGLTLTFHDLKSAAREVGVPCHHCARENPLGQHDCWFCGSSLVNAPTVTGRQLIVCRALARDGTMHDLTASNALLLDAEGGATLAVFGGTIAGARIVPGRDSVIAVPGGSSLRVNGAEIDAERVLAGGDIVTAAEGSDYLCILRQG